MAVINKTGEYKRISDQIRSSGAQMILGVKFRKVK